MEGANLSGALGKQLESSGILLENPEAGTKDLKNEYTKLDNVLVRYFKAQMTDEGDCTDKIQNADFKTMQTTGWQGSIPSLEHNVGEFFNCRFDMYQQLTGLEDGYYLIYVQGFYRNGGTAEAYEKHAKGTEVLDAVLYGNEDRVDVQSLYEDGAGLGGYNGYSDNREQAEKDFNHSEGTYANYLITKVEGGRLKLGLKKVRETLNDWTCFNNFQLYRLPKVTDIKDVTSRGGACPEAAYDLSGRKWDLDEIPSRKGIYIIGNKKKLIK